MRPLAIASEEYPSPRPVVFQITRGPPEGQDWRSPVSVDTPSRFGPRHCGQSPAVTLNASTNKEASFIRTSGRILASYAGGSAHQHDRTQDNVDVPLAGIQHVGAGEKACAPEKQGHLGMFQTESTVLIRFGIVQISAHDQNAFNRRAVGGADGSAHFGHVRTSFPQST